jgi:hypothetical protein
VRLSGLGGWQFFRRVPDAIEQRIEAADTLEEIEEKVAKFVRFLRQDWPF